MNKIGLSLTINKYSTYFESITHFLLFDTLDNTRLELINILTTHYKKLNINYPLLLNDFEYENFSQNYVKADTFIYKIFQDNKWDEPWDIQDIYEDVIEKIVNEDSENPPDFSEIYGEPNPDENKIDKFTMENDEAYQEMENKLKEIMDQTTSIKLNEEQVKDCKCQRCQQGYDHQQNKREVIIV